MELHCTRPGCPRPINHFTDLDDSAALKTVQQKYCMTCGMPLMLIGRYLPTKLLGRGGFGAAFLARDRYTPAMRYCVVKQFQPAGDLNPQQLEIAQTLFEREGQVLEELGNQHPQIPDLLAFFELEVPGSPSQQGKQFFYLVQEFIDGEDMEQELARRGQFSEAETQHVLTEILKVLAFVHSKQAIHRDIKPSNIMRDRRGRLFLLDFGAVKQITAGAAAGGSAKSTGIYSMGFAPPEQMAGSDVYPATDLYALGVTCITLLTGKQPDELYDAYSNSWNWRGFAQVSDRLEAILNRLLLPTPSQRFQSAEEVLSALAPTASAPAPAAQAPAAQPAQKSTAPVRSNPGPPLAAPTSVQPGRQPAAAPNPGPAPAPVAPRPAPPSRPPVSTLELLGGAAFTGFEGGLLAIALTSLLGTSLLSVGCWVALLAGLAIAQTRRWIEKLDLVIIAAITLAVIIFFPGLRELALVESIGSPVVAVAILAVLAGAIAVAAATLFRLVYKLLSSVL